ncbi:ABC transporter permease subunit [Streptomyces sp. NPDC088725]|uniref:ABC transporter permease subunit n=1 Tax=Streptomyces sp. NPDC088725 TaxID=3365873 RepID=UPI00380DB06A
MNHALHAEWVKLSSMRSHVWCLPVYVLVCLAISALMGQTSRNTDGIDPVAVGFSGMQSGMVLMVIVGVLAVTSEYASGTIRGSLLAVPRRGRFYAGKLGALALVTAVVSGITAPVSFLMVQYLLGDRGTGVDGEVVARMGGAVLYTVLLVVFSMGLATVLRSSTLTLGLLVPLFFMISTMLANIPATRQIAQFLPDMAGSLVLRQDLPAHTPLGATSGLAVLAAWAVAALVAGYVALVRRDA